MEIFKEKKTFFLSRAAQKMVETGVTKKRTADLSLSSIRNGGFCGALQRAPPPIPSNLARRLANKENYGLGKVSFSYMLIL